MQVTGLAVALGLTTGYLFGGLATEVMKLLGLAVTSPWLQEMTGIPEDDQCGCLVAAFHMGTIAVGFAFLLASLVGPFAYRVLRDQRGAMSRVKALCLAATAALLSLTVAGATLGAIEGKMAEILFYALIYFLIPLFQMLCHIMFLTFMRFCEFNHLVQSTILALFAVFYPSALMCPFLTESGPGLCLSIVILLAALHFLLICHVSSGTNCIPCFSLLLTMLIARNILHNGRFVSIGPHENMTVSTHIADAIFTGMMGTHLFAVGVGAMLLLSLGVREEGSLVSGAGAVAGGGVVFEAVRRVPVLLGTWGTLGALLGVSGAVGVALSAAGVAAQRYGGVVEERDRSTGGVEEREGGGGEALIHGGGRDREGEERCVDEGERDRNEGKEDEQGHVEVIKQRDSNRGEMIRQRGERERGGGERQGDEEKRGERDGDEEGQNGIVLGVHFILRLPLMYMGTVWAMVMAMPVIYLVLVLFGAVIWVLWRGVSDIWMRDSVSLLSRPHKNPSVKMPEIIWVMVQFGAIMVLWTLVSAIWMRGFLSLLSRQHKNPSVRQRGWRWWLRRARGRLVSVVKQYSRAVRVAGRRGLLGRVMVALGAAVGASLSAGGQRSGLEEVRGQDWRFKAFVAVCAAVIPLTGYRAVEKPSKPASGPTDHMFHDSL